MVKVLRKILGMAIYAGGLIFAATVIIGGFLMDCVWFMTCVIAGGNI